MNDLANLSADLMRIGEWIYKGEDLLWRKFIQRDIDKYSWIKRRIGRYSLSETLRRVQLLNGDRQKAAETALTAGVILSSVKS